MTPVSQNSLERQFAVAAKRLLQYPPSRHRLVPLLENIKDLLSKVNQSSEQGMQNALSPLKTALIREDLLKHSDADVKTGVGSCISEIIRITAPNIPYDHDWMKDVFQTLPNKRPYLRQVVKSLNTSLDDCSEVVSCVCGKNTETGGHSSGSILNDQPAGNDGSGKINFQGKNPTAAGSSKSVVNNGSIKETVTKEIKALDNHKIPERTWVSNVVVNTQLSDDEQEQIPIASLAPCAKILPSAVDKGKRVADAPLVKDLSKRHKSFKSKTPDLPLDKGKSKKRHSPNDFFTLELPKDINGEESSNPGPISKVVTQQFLQFASALGHLVQSVENSSNLPDLATKEKELALATQQVAELTKALEDQKKAFEEQKKINERSQQELIEHYLSREEDLKKKAFNDGLVKGFDFYRHRLFKSISGQEFLKELHEGLISAYRKSTEYLEDMGPCIGQSVSHGFRFALEQARSLGFEDELDATNLISTLKLSPAFEGDEKLPTTHRWWLPVMNSAVKKLVSNDIIGPEAFPFDVFYPLDLPESSSGHRK